MNELVVIAEGQTEQTFVRDQLAGHLATFGISAWARLSGKSQKNGGVKKWEAARGDIIRTLKENRFVTTMVDYYAMPDDWPGRTAAKSVPWQNRATTVENAVANDIQTMMGVRFDRKYFIPYVQLHEFESLTFADTAKLAAVVAPLSSQSIDTLKMSLDKILQDAGHPEAINDGYETCPSRRIQGIAKAYRKRATGPIVTRRIGLDKLRSECTHFAAWLARLEKIV
jgi:hypothetical protein